MNKKHLAIFEESVLEEIYSGRKTVETRFSKNRIAPFGVVSAGDIVYLKASGKVISGQFIVKKVIFLENIDQKDWEFIKTSYGKELSLGSKGKDQDFFKAKEQSKFGTLIFVGNVEKFITPPITIPKTDRRGWVVLDF